MSKDFFFLLQNCVSLGYENLLLDERNVVFYIYSFQYGGHSDYSATASGHCLGILGLKHNPFPCTPEKNIVSHYTPLPFLYTPSSERKMKTYS